MTQEQDTIYSMRLSPALAHRITSAVETTGLKKVDVIRLSIERGLDHLVSQLSANRYFPERIRETNPCVVVRAEDVNGNPLTAVDRRTGTHYRVFPSTAREIALLQMLEHSEEKFAPATGVGVILTEQALEMIDA